MSNDVSRVARAIESYSQSSWVITTRRVDLPRCSIGDCLDLMSTIPDVKIGSDLYMMGTRLFVKRECKEMFFALTNNDYLA